MKKNKNKSNKTYSTYSVNAVITTSFKGSCGATTAASGRKKKN